MERFVNALGKLSCRKRAYAALVLFAWTATLLAAQAPTYAQTPTILHRFNDTNGSGPYTALIQGTDGDLHGSTYYGGATGVDGTIFKMTTSGVATTVHSFVANPYNVDASALVEDTDGSYYGTTYFGGTSNNGTVFKLTTARVFTTLYSFCTQSGCVDGSFPRSALVQGTDGNLYGTTSEGGASNAGTVFKITRDGMLTTLHSFDPQVGEGGFPFAGLVQGTDGSFYGVSNGGGAAGTVFKITQGGIFSTLYTFGSTFGDGAQPSAPLIQATDGNFYGTTDEYPGTIFRVTPRGALTTLYTFCAQSNCADGTNPPYGAGLFQATDGNFYGTTQYGGNGGGFPGSGYGTIFMMRPDGT